MTNKEHEIFMRKLFDEKLDKIRAEILSIGKYEEYRELMPNFELEQVIKIIDKYRGESDCRECKAEHDCYECEKYEESEG